MLSLLRPFAGVDRRIILLFVFGAALRTLYASGTPFDVRAYDAIGHIEYLRHMALTFSVPEASQGFLFHHAPLYYAIGGSLWTLSEALGLGTQAIFSNLQLLSLLLSFATLGAGMAALRVAFKDAHTAVMACGVFACFPGLAMFSSRLSNDTLYATFSVLAVLLLLHWWKHGRKATWIALWACIGLACLTKANGITLAAPVLACLVLRGKPVLRRKLGLAVTGIAILLAMTGWYGALRVSEPDTRRTLDFGNLTLNPRLRVGNDPSDYVLFNPLGLLEYPFLNPWDDATRRDKLWEYVFRSSLFGEFRYPRLYVLGIVLVLTALAALPLMAWGVWVSRSLHAAVPMGLVALTLLGSVMAYRFLFPNASNQDFRFIPALALPVSFYAAAGYAGLRKLLRDAAAALLVFLCALCAALLVALSLGPSLQTGIPSPPPAPLQH